MKMTSSIELKLKDAIKNEASRNNAIKVRKQIISLLKNVEIVEINLQDSNFTPSVADEIIGTLAEKLGAHLFKQKIKIKNASEAQLALIKHVIARRLSNKTHTKEK